MADLSSPLTQFLIGAALVLLLLIVVAIIAAVLIVHQLQRFISPDILRLQQQLDQRRKAQPGVALDSHMQAIIQQQAFRAGLVGAITGLGGFITLPIALPVDLILSMRIQATLVQFIASVYGHGVLDGASAKVQNYLITTGTVEVTETTFNWIMKIVLRVLGESLSMLLPAIGALIGFVLNFGIASATGHVALRLYSGSSQPVLINPPR